MLWARLLAYATETVDQELLLGKRISGGGEPDPERSDQGSVTAFGRRKGDTGRDRSPPGSNGGGGRGDRACLLPCDIVAPGLAWHMRSRAMEVILRRFGGLSATWRRPRSAGMHTYS